MNNITNKLGQASVLVAGILATGTMTVPNTVQADMFATDKFSLYGDFRFRLESDWDSHKADGVTTRDDRNRARIRARVGFNYNHNEYFSYGARLRSGSDNNHLSPHITVLDFDGNDTGSAQFNFDKWFLEMRNNEGVNFKKGDNGAWGWIGRNSLPYWKQNEMFWDDDATPTGLAMGYKTKLGASQLAMNAGYFSLPAGMQKFAGNLGLGQAVLSTKLGANKLTAAGGLLAFEANPDGDSDATHSSLWDGNGGRDYQIWILSLQGKFKAGGLPLTLGLDMMHNNKGYSDTDPDPFTVANRDETDGYVLSAKLGQLKKPNDWLLGYYYAHIETFAVNSSYAQDDWGRWNPQSSNMKGHELRGAYQAMKNLNVVARFYSIEDITDDQDGKRFRLDFNYKF